MKELEIIQLLPSEALQEIHQPDSQLVRLVLEGYDLTESARKDPAQAASFDYNFPDDRAVIFIAKQDNMVVGSLTYIIWKDGPNDKRGSKFWPTLRQLDATIAQRACDQGSVTCDVGGIVVLPEARGKNIGRRLLKAATEQMHPAIIVGNTKTVEAVMTRRSLADLGYRIFYGDSEITPSNEQITTSVHQAVLRAYLFAKDFKDRILPEGNVFVYEGGLAATMPITNTFPLIIQEAFKPIKAAQRLSKTRAVMGPLLAIRKELLD